MSKARVSITIEIPVDAPDALLVTRVISILEQHLEDLRLTNNPMYLPNPRNDYNHISAKGKKEYWNAESISWECIRPFMGAGIGHSEESPMECI